MKKKPTHKELLKMLPYIIAMDGLNNPEYKEKNIQDKLDEEVRTIQKNSKAKRGFWTRLRGIFRHRL